jgi:hypothetical protein
LFQNLVVSAHFQSHLFIVESLGLVKS